MENYVLVDKTTLVELLTKHLEFKDHSLPVNEPINYDQVVNGPKLSVEELSKLCAIVHDNWFHPNDDVKIIPYSWETSDGSMTKIRLVHKGFTVNQFINPNSLLVDSGFIFKILIDTHISSGLAEHYRGANKAMTTLTSLVMEKLIK